MPTPTQHPDSPSPSGTTTTALPPPFHNTTPRPTLIAQGAEALLYRTTFLTPRTPCALKVRPSKPYRHPTLDARLTRHRILSEARVLVKCRREGVCVPAVWGLDWVGGGQGLGGEEGEGGKERGGGGKRGAGGWMMMEWVEGRTVRGVLDGVLLGRKEGRAGIDAVMEGGQEEGKAEEDAVPVPVPVPEQETGLGKIWERENADLEALMRKIGVAVGKMHAVGVVHGDLTTSNLMLRPAPSSDPATSTSTTTITCTSKGTPTDTNADGDGASPTSSDVSAPRPSLDGEIVLIDFGLAAQSTQDEDKAVDLYVLERAFGSTHPRAEGLFREVLKAYGECSGGAKVVLRRLEEVRMRGRKRSMIG